jgi:hypothetical protein
MIAIIFIFLQIFIPILVQGKSTKLKTLPLLVAQLQSARAVGMQPG